MATYQFNGQYYYETDNGLEPTLILSPDTYTADNVNGGTIVQIAPTMFNLVGSTLQPGQVQRLITLANGAYMNVEINQNGNYTIKSYYSNGTLADTSYGTSPSNAEGCDYYYIGFTLCLYNGEPKLVATSDFNLKNGLKQGHLSRAAYLDSWFANQYEEPPEEYHSGAGSGYIGNALLSNKKMVGYNVPTSSDTDTKTESVQVYSANAEANKPKAGNGYVKITWLRGLPPLPAPVIPDTYTNVVLELFHANGTVNVGGVMVYNDTYWSIFYCNTSSSITVANNGAVSAGTYNDYKGGASNREGGYDYEFHSDSGGAVGFDTYTNVHEKIYVSIKGQNNLTAFPTHYDSWEAYRASL